MDTCCLVAEIAALSEGITALNADASDGTEPRAKVHKVRAGLTSEAELDEGPPTFAAGRHASSRPLDALHCCTLIERWPCASRG
mmetsp:Transcript_380/g.856  ORF Transcript_380/g.856 Transcript_380/m.856 type:complete len:84 (+) Transcript_380:618-869(+)